MITLTLNTLGLIAAAVTVLALKRKNQLMQNMARKYKEE